MLICGLDVGTTGCKLTTYTHKGEFVYNSYKEYDVSRKSGQHEVDANDIFNAVCDVIKDTSTKEDISAIGITTFGETFVLLDENDNVLLPSMLYTDPRGEEECKKLSRTLGDKRIADISGVKPNQMYSLPKIMWIKNNKPDIFKKAKRIMLMQDYIVYKLTGNAFIDYSLAARTMAFDIREKCWSKELFAAADIDTSLMSTPVPAFHVAGKVKDNLAKTIGLKSDVLIVNGAHDQVAAAVGAGILTPGEAVDGTGTVECVTPVFDKIPCEEKVYNEGYSVVPYVLDGTYVYYALSFTGGAVIKWYRDNFARDKSYKELDLSVADSPTGILVLPHFAGAANPYMDNTSKAAFVGLTLEHTDADIYKALMEGVTYEIMTNISELESVGIIPRKLYATGGGAYSDVWLQIKADILGRPITALEAKEAGTSGTCMMTGVAVGIYSSLYEAKQFFVREKGTFLPDQKKHEVYQKYFSTYKKLYSTIRPITKEL